MKHYRGFTLIELMVTIVIVAILLGIAVPEFSTFMKNNRIATAASELLADLALARSEAGKRGQNVTVCISSDGATCAGTDWMGGRLVFADGGTAGVVDSGDTIIRFSEAKNNGTTMTSENFANTGFVRYSASGTVTTGSTNKGSFKICDSRTGNFGRVITLTNTGRPLTQTSQPCP